MSGRDAESTRLVVSACSSFFSLLKRRFDEIRNHLPGVPCSAASTWTEAVIPTAAELEVLDAGRAALASALAVAIERGFASGGYQGSQYGTTGPGTRLEAHRLQAAEPLSARTLRALRSARLDARRPFRAGKLPTRARLDGVAKGNPQGALSSPG